MSDGVAEGNVDHQIELKRQTQEPEALQKPGDNLSTSTCPNKSNGAPEPDRGADF